MFQENFKKKWEVSFLIWENNGIRIIYTEIRQIMNVTSGDSTLHKHIELLLGGGTFQVIYNMHLINAVCEYFNLE